MTRNKKSWGCWVAGRKERARENKWRNAWREFQTQAHLMEPVEIERLFDPLSPQSNVKAAVWQTIKGWLQ